MKKFLKDLGISFKDAILHFNLALLSTRRDIAALGVIHRAILRQGPSQLHSFFILDNDTSYPKTRLGSRRHQLQVVDLYSNYHRDYLDRSMLGYVWIYNLLPADVVESRSVKLFQRKFHWMVKDLASQDYENWSYIFSPRLGRLRNPLLRMTGDLQS